MPRIDTRHEFIMPMVQTRRRFMTGLSLAGAAGCYQRRQSPQRSAWKPPRCALCAPRRSVMPRNFVIEELLRAEGFTDIRYVEGASTAEINPAVASGKVDFNPHFAPQWVSVIDGGEPVTVLSGVHVGCFELFGNAGIRSIADLKGKTVGIAALGSPDHLFVSVPRASLPHACIHRHRSRRHPTLPRRGASPFRASRRTQVSGRPVRS